MQHKYLFGFAGIAGLAIALAFLFSCTAPGNENLVKTATLKGPSAMAMIFMLEEKRAIGGVPVEYKIYNEPNQIKALILEESVDFAVVPSTMGALLYNRTGKYILAGIPVWGTLYLFGTDPEIEGWKDLPGKKVSLMARGMTPDIMFRYLAQQNGVDPESMELDYSFPGHIELANAIAAGVSGLGVISEPMVSLVKSKNPQVRSILNFNEEWKKLFGADVPFAQTALLVHKEFASEHPEKVSIFLEQLKKSIQKSYDIPAEAAKLIVKHEILPDTALALQALPFCNLRFSHSYEEKAGIEEYFKVFYTFNPNILGDRLPDEDFYFKKPVN